MSNTNLKHALLASAFVLAAMAMTIAVELGISSLYATGTEIDVGHLSDLSQPIYLIIAIGGTLCGFIGGYLFTPLLERSEEAYSARYETISPEYTHKICRFRLIARYSLAIALITGLPALGLVIFVRDTDPIAMAICLLTGCTACSLLFLFYSRHQARTLHRDRFHLLTQNL